MVGKKVKHINDGAGVDCVVTISIKRSQVVLLMTNMIYGTT